MAIINYGVMFNGRRIVHPGAYDAIDASAMLVSTPGSLNRPIVVGEADAGTPGKVVWFSTAPAARAYTVGGELPTAIDLMFSPSPEGGGGSSVVGVLVTNALTQAQLVAGGLTQTAQVYGEGGNRISTKLEDSVNGSKKFTVSRWDTDDLEVFDNLGTVIKIQYKGTKAYAGMTVTANAGKATSLVIKTGADAGTATVETTVDLTDSRWDTVGELGRYLGSISDYDVSFTDSQLESSKLDAIANVAFKATPAYVMAVGGDLVYQVNNLSQLVQVSLTGTLANFPATYLTGGSKGVSASSWATHFDTIKREFSDILVVLTADQSIQAEALAHVGQMELRGQRQELFVGGGLGETVDQIKRRALLFNSSRAVVAYPGIYAKDTTGQTKLLPGYFTAAMVAGRASGVDPSEPLTFDYFNLIGLENDLVAGDPDVDDLITSGVATLERVFGGGIRLAQAVTTDLTPGSPFRELSIRRGADALSTKVTRALEARFVGKKGLAPTITDISLATKEILTQAVKNEEISAFRNITVTFEATVVRVDYEVAYAEPINYILTTSHYVPSVS